MLVVDDDADACEMVNLLLKPHQIEVTCAPTPIEAWRLIKSEVFDLLMLDVWLPRQDGYEFRRQVREFDSNTPILFIRELPTNQISKRELRPGQMPMSLSPSSTNLSILPLP